MTASLTFLVHIFFLLIMTTTLSTEGQFLKGCRMYKSCSRCGKIHATGHKCTVGRIYTGGDERSLRSKYAWTEKSKEIRERANHLCEVCRDQGQITYDNIEVHHIVKVRDDKSKLLDNENLICLCQEHHTQADNNEIDSTYLTKLARIREQGQVISTQTA